MPGFAERINFTLPWEMVRKIRMPIKRWMRYDPSGT